MSPFVAMAIAVFLSSLPGPKRRAVELVSVRLFPDADAHATSLAKRTV